MKNKIGILTFQNAHNYRGTYTSICVKKPSRK